MSDKHSQWSDSGPLKLDKKRVPYAKKYTGFKKSTPLRVVTVVTNISYGAGRQLCRLITGPRWLYSEASYYQQQQILAVDKRTEHSWMERKKGERWESRENIPVCSISINVILICLQFILGDKYKQQKQTKENSGNCSEQWKGWNVHDWSVC